MASLTEKQQDELPGEAFAYIDRVRVLRADPGASSLEHVAHEQ